MYCCFHTHIHDAKLCSSPLSSSWTSLCNQTDFNLMWICHSETTNRDAFTHAYGNSRVKPTPSQTHATIKSEKYRETWLYKEKHTVGLDGSRDVFTEALVYVEHVQVYATQLNNKRVSYGFTRSDVGLQDAAQLLHCLRVLQDVHILQQDKSIHLR